MRYQETTYSCGAAAVLNAARCFGRRVPERIVRSIAETTPPDGTNEEGIRNALTILGLDGLAFEDPDAPAAIGRITEELVRHGNPSIICTQNMQHWVLVVGTLDGQERYLVVDSARTKLNMKENGTRVLSAAELSKTWQARNGMLFGIVVRRPARRSRRKR